MKCHQCNNNAIWLFGDSKIPLCLDCYFRIMQIYQQRQETAERLINFMGDQMASSLGMPPMGPRFPPRTQPIVIAGAKLQNIHVNNSVVGTINTGSIGTIDQSISALMQDGQSELAKAIKALSEAILNSRDLTQNQKNELIEIISVLSREAVTPEEARQKSVAQTLLEKATKVTALANDITDVCQKWWPVLGAAIAGATGG